MPVGVHPRRQENQHVASPSTSRDATEEERLAQLQQATQHDDDRPGDGGGDDAPAAAPAPVTDGARNPVAAGAKYTSLRAITRRAPRNPDYLVDGVDTSSADLSWNALDSLTDPQGRPWKYPKRRSKAEGSNLEQFREEIEQRTKDGQGCKAIAEVLVEKGVDTSSRAVARMRLKWGLRQRAPRRMTQQGIANIRRAHAEHAKRMADSDPVPVKRVRIRVLRKAEIVRMTREGMGAAEIAENLSARGVQLSRGAATVERLRTVWGLLDGSGGAGGGGGGPRSVARIRATARARALKAQREQFEDVARELGVGDVGAWVKAKMDEDVAQDARRNYAYKLMGDAAPQPHLRRRAAAQAKSNRLPNGPVDNTFTGMPGVDFAPHVSPGITPAPAWPGEPEGAAAAAASRTAQEFPATRSPSGLPPPRELVDLTDDDEDDIGDDEVDDDLGRARDAQETSASAEPRERTSLAQDSRSPNPSSRPEMDNNNSASAQHSPFQPPHNAVPPTQNTYPMSHLPLPSSLPQTAGPAPPPAPSPVHNGVLDPASRRNELPYPSEPREPLPPNVPLKVIRTAPPAGLPGRPPSSLAPSAPPALLPPRPLAPRPPPGPLGGGSGGQALAPPRPVAAPLLVPPSGPQRTEADYMGRFGLLPYPAPPGRRPQRHTYSTPGGLVTTHGYEYLWAAPPNPPAGRGLDANAPPATQPGTDWILVPQPQPQPQPQPGPPPPPHAPQLKASSSSSSSSRIPAPPLVIPEEEARAREADRGAVERLLRVGRECLEVLAARAERRPLAEDSLTGLPPSLRDVQGAKERLREAARVLAEEL